MKTKKRVSANKAFKKELKEKDFRVAIFGSARIDKEKASYKQISSLARMLGEHGIEVVTGGGPGLMKAASLGHKEGSKKRKKNGLKPVHTIGLGIKLPWEQGYNKGVGISKDFSRFSKRLDNFMLLSNAVVVAPGGVGTLLEFFYTWQLVQVKHICSIPIILLGDMWTGLLEWLEKGPMRRKLFTKHDFRLLYHAKTVKDAMRIIEKAHKEYEKGTPGFCVNSDRYRLD